MFGSMIRKYKKKYTDAVQKLKDAEKFYDKAMEEANCSGCDNLGRGNVQKSIDRHALCLNCDKGKTVFCAAHKEDDASIELDKAIDEYARAIFEYYSKRNICLTNKKTGEKIEWEEQYGEDYNILSMGKKHSLVGLLEKYGQYEIL